MTMTWDLKNSSTVSRAGAPPNTWLRHMTWPTMRSSTQN